MSKQSKIRALLEQMFTEVGEGTQPYPMKERVLSEDIVGYEFRLEDQTRMVIQFDGAEMGSDYAELIQAKAPHLAVTPIQKLWDLSFGSLRHDGVLDYRVVLNKGSMYKIMSTVAAALNQFITNHDPDYIHWSTSHKPGVEKQGTSQRSSLYQAYIKKHLPSGWTSEMWGENEAFMYANQELKETDQFGAQRMQYVKAFASVHPEKYKELVEWVGADGKRLEMLETYLKAWSSESWNDNLHLNGIPIEDFGSLQSVTNSLVLFSAPIKDLGNLQSVGGNLYLQRSDVESLGSLKSVGADLMLTNTPIEDLGQLRSVGGELNLTHTPIKSLGQLQTVVGSLHLQYSQIEDLGQLQKVSGDIYMDGTPASKTHTQEQVRQRVEIGGNLFI